MESLLEAVVEQRGELGRDGIPLLERGFYRLHAMVTRVGERRAIDPSEALIEEFNARALGKAAPAATPADAVVPAPRVPAPGTELKSEEHTSELQSLMRLTYRVFCLKKQKKKTI